MGYLCIRAIVNNVFARLIIYTFVHYYLHNFAQKGNYPSELTHYFAFLRP